MNYYMDTTIACPAPYTLTRPAVMRQGDVNPCEDPWMTCGFQSTYYQQRAIYPLWDETAIQEVPTGLEYHNADNSGNKSCPFTSQSYDSWNGLSVSRSSPGSLETEPFEE